MFFRKFSKFLQVVTTQKIEMLKTSKRFCSNHVGLSRNPKIHYHHDYTRPASIAPTDISVYPPNMKDHIHEHTFGPLQPSAATAGHF